MPDNENQNPWNPKESLPSHWIAIPSGFDLQVHLRYPGQSNKETLQGGVASAFFGGYDSVLAMPNTSPFLDTPERFSSAIESLEKESQGLYPLNIFVSASATLDMKGDTPSDIKGLKEAGAMAITDDGWGVRSKDAMREILQLCQENQILFLQHAEAPGHGGVATSSPFQQKHGLKVYPREAESQMFQRDLELLRDFPETRYHILHISTVETLDLLKKAKDEGLNVTAEVTPHHLLFDNTMIPDENKPNSTSYKMNPPLFSPRDREQLVDALASGDIDCVSTDHAPHSNVEKQKGWSSCPFGTRGLESSLLALWELHKRGSLSFQRLIDVFSKNGRKILLGESAKPSGTVYIDPTHDFTFSEANLPGISQNSIFLGTRFSAKIVARHFDSGLFTLFEN